LRTGICISMYANSTIEYTNMLAHTKAPMSSRILLEFTKYCVIRNNDIINSTVANGILMISYFFMSMYSKPRIVTDSLSYYRRKYISFLIFTG
jgi:hypothetical protein